MSGPVDLGPASREHVEAAWFAWADASEAWLLSAPEGRVAAARLMIDAKCRFATAVLVASKFKGGMLHLPPTRAHDPPGGYMVAVDPDGRVHEVAMPEGLPRTGGSPGS